MPSAEPSRYAQGLERKEKVLQWLTCLYNQGRFPRWFDAKDVRFDTGVSTKSAGGLLNTFSKQTYLPFSLALHSSSGNTWRMDARSRLAPIPEESF